MIEQFSKNWALYTGIAFLACLATYSPITRVGISLLIGSYLLYGVSQVFVAFSNIEKNGQGSGRSALLWAFSFEMADFIFLLVAVVIGIYLGLK